MSLETWATFLVLWILAAASPGPNVAFTVATGLATPMPKALLAPLGIGLGGLVYAVAISAGLGTLLVASAEAFLVIKWLGVAYLVYLGLRQWRLAARDGELARPLQKPRGGGRLVAQAAFVMVANPKAALSYAAIFPAFVAPELPAAPQFAILSLTAAAGSIAVHMAYVSLAGRLGAWRAMQRRPAAVRGASGALFLLAALGLALVKRGSAPA